MALKVRRSGLSLASAGALRAVTPDDDADLPDGPCRAFEAKTSGLVTVIAVDDTVPQQLYLIQGVTKAVRARRVLATGTDATGIVALY